MVSNFCTFFFCPDGDYLIFNALEAFCLVLNCDLIQDVIDVSQFKRVEAEIVINFSREYLD